MTHQTLLIYSTIDGHTRHICERMKFVMTAMGQNVTLVPLDQAEALSLDKFQRVVIGASIRYGKHRPQVAEFIKKHRPVLDRKANALFSVNVVARKPEKNQPHTNPYMVKLLQQLGWKPQLAGVFAGRLNYPALGFVDKQMIRFIMLITKGPTDPTQAFEFTDWAAVETFAQQVCALPVPGAPANQ
ncbi:MAG: protoporphyrinogen oxidase [Rhodoferax ferrireducens]|uniref:Protoporphyrinogen IX dehydrogenase [quinone] n=1 Tax=Rhodoferax ferrireducens TaxID=192843 RepID=A0A1W9KTR6_9BURK|nr:MAG: protoporphyrinogen oxidase [Rhodoferax ferrireducens]